MLRLTEIHLFLIFFATLFGQDCHGTCPILYYEPLNAWSKRTSGNHHGAFSFLCESFGRWSIAGASKRVFVSTHRSNVAATFSASTHSLCSGEDKGGENGAFRE
jgi:hypothetical protein